MSGEGSTQLHAVVGCIFVVTAAIEYVRTGCPNPSGENYSANTTLAQAMSALIMGVINYARKGLASSVATALVFCALYLFSFSRLQAGQCYGYENALLVSMVLGLGFLSPGVKVVGILLPKEFCLLGIYSTALFANAINFWLGLVLSLSFAMLAVGNDGFHCFMETRLPLKEPE